MGDEGDVAAVAAAEVAEVAEAPAAAAEPVFDETSAVKEVLKKALVYDGLARGLREAAKAIEKGQASLVLLAQDCTEQNYKNVIEALAAEQNVNLLHVPSNKARKVVSCSCVVVKNFGEQTPALAWLLDYLKNKQ